MSEPLSKNEFNSWKDNHFNSLMREVSRIKGILWVMLPMLILIFSLVLSLLFK